MSMIESLVEQIEARFAEAQAQMSDPEVIADRQRYADAGRAFNQLAPAAKLAEEWRLAVSDAEGAEELLDEGEDAEMRAELDDARERIERLEEEIRLAMVERDPNDDKNVIVEIRGGAGGDEAGIWAGDLYRMYQRYAERLGFKAETMEASDGSYTFEIKGDGAYSIFKFEGGTHRVQRVPETESQGRIHTSTATVAVLPEVEDVEVNDRPERPADRRLPLLRPGRAVGQHDRLGRADHAQADRDRDLDAGREVPAAEPRAGDEAAAREALRGRAGRAAGRARAPSASRRSAPATARRRSAPTTIPQRRVTDHRINFSVHNLEQVLAGEPDELTSALQDAEKRSRLEEQAESLSRRPLASTTVRDALDSAMHRADRGGLRHAAAGRRGAARGGAGRRPRDADRRPASASSTGEQARAFMDAVAAPARARAGRLHPRHQGLPAPRAARSTGGC